VVAREHTIAKECAKSPLVEKVMVTPGNGGISKEFTSFSVGVEDNQSNRGSGSGGVG
jgi:phosphoribosylamine-glycine ligase